MNRTCLVCHNKEAHETNNLQTQINCPRCGRYQIAEELIEDRILDIKDN